MADRTKLWIANVMKELMTKKSLDKIRVSEICKKAEIKRPTFYYHFQDKYDCVAWIFMYSAEKTDITNIDSATKAMEDMKKDFIFYKRALEDNSQNPLWQYMKEYFVKMYSKILMEKKDIKLLDKQTEFSIKLYCYGCAGMTREWLLFDNITPARTVVEMMFHSMPEELKSLTNL